MKNTDLKLGVCGLLVGFATWMGLFYWDRTYTHDAAGSLQGPYDIWQCVLAGLILLAGAVYCGRRYGFGVGMTYGLTATLGFDAGFALTAHNDVTGLWIFGLMVLTVAVMLGMVIFVGLGALMRKKSTGASPARVD